VLQIYSRKITVRQWSIKEGDKLDWPWEVQNNEMVVVVRKVKAKK